MEWKRLTAVFGKLDNHTLELKEGFNLIYAPNESGKSTWCAFLRTMLYGIPSKDRKQTADKNRYAPWAGKALEGQTDLIADGRAITLTRRTLRSAPPMSAFSACYTDTATPVSHLSAATCGEILTGVPREVFERSAFINQSSMVIDQDAELERRIVALMTSGEEAASFSETAERLKKQLNKRRYHKTGTLPTLDAEIDELRSKLQHSHNLQQQLLQAQRNLVELEQQEEQLLHHLAEASATSDTATHREFAQLQQQAEQADALVQQRRAEVAALPQRKTLAALKSAAGNILVNQLALRSLRTQTQLREKERLEAQQAVDSFPLFSGLTDEEARTQAAADQLRYHNHLRSRKRAGLVCAVLPLVAVIALAAAILAKLPPIFISAAAPPLLPIPFLLISADKQKKKASALLSVYGTSDASFSRQAEEYYIIYSRLTACLQEEEAARAREKKLENDLLSSQKEIILQAQTLDDTVTDLSSATAAIDSAISAWTRYEAARQAQEQLYARCEALSAIIGDSAALDPVETIRAELQAGRAAIQDTRRQLSSLQSQLQLCGSEEVIQTLLAEKKQQRAAVQREYDAISMALVALTEANTNLQNRFSPELGKKSAKYFAKLTKGKYNTVLLSRELEASAQQSDSPIPRPFWQLSQGAAEQLYLAVRLAICELVLPEEKAVPIVLDDALSCFDDERMAAALDVLMELSQKRQVLFFTCQKREADYLRRAYPDQFFCTEL